MVREVILRLPEAAVQTMDNRWYKILWALYGSAEMELSTGEKFVIRPGDVLILPAECTQYIYKGKGSQSQDSLHLMIYCFDFQELQAGHALGSLLRRLGGVPRLIDTGSNLLLWELYCKLRQQFDHPLPEGKKQTGEAFAQWLQTVSDIDAQGAGLVEAGRREREQMLKELFYQRQKAESGQGREGLRGAKLAEDESLKEFAKKVQIERAKLLLMNRNLPVEALAKESGYRSARTFYRNFQDYVKMSPKDYRSLVAGKMLNNVPYFIMKADLGGMGRGGQGQESMYDLGLSHAREYIKKNIARPLSLEEIAWAVNVSEEHLCRMFREALNMTVMDYIRNLRLHNVKHLLVCEPELSLERVAERVGFSTVSLFCRVFKEVEQCTPREFRERKKPSHSVPRGAVAANIKGRQ